MAEPASHVSSRVRIRSVARSEAPVSAKVVQKWRVCTSLERPADGKHSISKGVLSRGAGNE